MSENDGSSAQQGRQQGSPSSGGDQAQGGPADAKARGPSLVERHPWLRLAAAGAAVVIVIGAVLFWLHHRRYQTTDDAEVDADIASVSARVKGHVIAVHVQDGQFVHAGVVVLEIDTHDFIAARDRARAQYANAQAEAKAASLEVPVAQSGSTSQIRTAEAGMASAAAGVAAAERQVDEADASLVKARAAARTANADVARYTPLIDKREISQQQFDQAVTAADSANAEVSSGEASVRKMEAQLQEAREKQHQAEAVLADARASANSVQATAARADSAQSTVQSAFAALEQTELDLSYTLVKAPIDGIVGRRSVETGQNVEPGQELFSIAPAQGLWVTANFKETQLLLMRPGQPVSIDVDGCSHGLTGRVTSIGGATGSRYSLLPPENASGNYVKVVQRIPVRIDFDQSPGVDQDSVRQCLLRPGMSVTPSVLVR